jgi:outer membrane autotransporter protein
MSGSSSRIAQRSELSDAALLADLDPASRAVSRAPFVDPGEWSSWGDWRRVDFSDNRWSRDLDGQVLQYQLGVDRALNERTYVGLAAVYETADAHQFNNLLDSDLQRVVLGPYLGYQAADNVYLDAWLGYVWSSTKSSLAGLDADVDGHDWFVSLNATTVLPYGQLNVLPKASFYYAETRTDSFSIDVVDASGQYRGAIDAPSERDDFGYLGGSLEFNRTWQSDWQWQPYVRIGSYYAYQQLQDGQVLNGDLTSKQASRWQNQGTLGMRVQLNGSLLLEGEYADQALADDDLDIEQWKLALNYWF